MASRYYVPQGASQAERDKLRKRHVCAECSEWLSMWLDTEGRIYLACHEHQRTKHEGIAKPYENREYNIATRKEFMTTELGEQKTQALAKYSTQTSLSKQDADTIIDTIWPEARAVSPAEVYKAVTIATQYGLNPLMKHLYLIPFNTKVGDTWERRFVTVLGIGANRLIASRRHSYSYIDDSPRLMSEEEQAKIFGEIDSKNLRAITILKDMKTGASARGYGSWPKDTEPKGTDKGNSKANMAFIRSERQALDRLFPADLPHDVEVVDERYEVTARVEPETIPPPGDAPAAEVKESTPDPDWDRLKGNAEIPTESKDTTQGESKPVTTPTSEKGDPIGDAARKMMAKEAQAKTEPPPREQDVTMVRSAASKLKWDAKRLNTEIRARFGFPTLADIPDQKLHEVANKLTDLAAVA